MSEMVNRILKDLEKSEWWMSEFDLPVSRAEGARTIGEELVRAVIAAMREPTMKMTIPNSGMTAARRNAEVYRAMIDEALK